jgi:LacI family transcriptional regulator
MGALQANQLTYRPEYVFAGDITVEAGKAAAHYFLQLPDPPDAIFTVEDYAALGVINALKERGINVPEEMGVFGFCNDQVGNYLSPSLSTIDQQTELMGQKAFHLICEMIAHADDKHYTASKIVLNPLPVIRESSLKQKHL